MEHSIWGGCRCDAGRVGRGFPWYRYVCEGVFLSCPCPSLVDKHPPGWKQRPTFSSLRPTSRPARGGEGGQPWRRPRCKTHPQTTPPRPGSSAQRTRRQGASLEVWMTSHRKGSLCDCDHLEFHFFLKCGRISCSPKCRNLRAVVEKTPPIPFASSTKSVPSSTLPRCLESRASLSRPRQQHPRRPPFPAARTGAPFNSAYCTRRVEPDRLAVPSRRRHPFLPLPDSLWSLAGAQAGAPRSIPLHQPVPWRCPSLPNPLPSAVRSTRLLDKQCYTRNAVGTIDGFAPLTSALFLFMQNPNPNPDPPSSRKRPNRPTCLVSARPSCPAASTTTTCPKSLRPLPKGILPNSPQSLPLSCACPYAAPYPLGRPRQCTLGSPTRLPPLPPSVPGFSPSLSMSLIDSSTSPG